MKSKRTAPTRDPGPPQEPPEIFHNVLLAMEERTTGSGRVQRDGITGPVHTLHISSIDRPALVRLTQWGWQQIPTDFKDRGLYYPDEIAAPALRHLEALEHNPARPEFIFRHRAKPLFFSASFSSPDALQPLMKNGWIIGDFGQQWREYLASGRVLQDTSLPQLETRQVRQMIEDEYAEQLGRSLAEKTLTKGGIRYFPVSFAAPLAQAPESTIRYWISQDTKFEGKLIKSHISPANSLYVSEDSVRRMARRFVKYRDGKPAGPAGPVILGETDDQRGYIGLTDAARTLGVERHTIWRWAMKGTAPEGRTLDIIKDSASDQFYISEQDVSALSQYVPRTGLSRGPRPQPVLQS